MVLKWLTYEKDSKGDGYHEIWNFVDNVKESSVYWDDKSTCTCVKVSFGDGDNKVFAVQHSNRLRLAMVKIRPPAIHASVAQR